LFCRSSVIMYVIVVCYGYMHIIAKYMIFKPSNVVITGENNILVIYTCSGYKENVLEVYV